PARFIAGNNSLEKVEVLRPPSFELHMAVAIVRVGQLGALERAVGLLEHGIRHLFEAANTRKPVTRSRRSVPANRRKARPPKYSPDIAGWSGAVLRTLCSRFFAAGRIEAAIRCAWSLAVMRVGRHGHSHMGSSAARLRILLRT